MAPAAKEGRREIVGRAYITVAAPMTAKMGSTIADSCPHFQLFYSTDTLPS